MDSTTSAEAVPLIPCEACNGTGMLPASTSSSSNPPWQIGGSASFRTSVPFLRCRRSSAPERRGYNSSLRNSLSTLPFSQDAVGSSSSAGHNHPTMDRTSGTSLGHQEQNDLLGPQEQNATAHRLLDDDNTRNKPKEEGMGHRYQQDMPESSADMEIDQAGPRRYRDQLVSTARALRPESRPSNSLTSSINNINGAPPLSTVPPVSHMSRFQAQVKAQSRYPSSSPSSSTSSSGATAPLLTSHNSSHNSAHNSDSHVATTSTIQSSSDSSASRTATIRKPGSIASSSRAGSSRPTLPPIKHLLDDIDDWPQARAPRASSMRSRERSPVYEFILRTGTTSPEPTINVQSSLRSPSISHHPIFARPAVPPQGNSSSSANASFRLSNLAEQDYNAYELNDRSASDVKPYSQQNVRDREDNPNSFQANKRLRRTSSSPRDRMSALSLGPSGNDSNRLSRPTLAVPPGHADKYHSYFADAKLNNIESNGFDGHLYDYGTGLDNNQTPYPIGDETLIVTPSLETTRGAELEAAIHLAGIAASGANERPRGAHERIYVTTSAAPFASSTHRQPLQHEQGAMQRDLRALRAMGSSSDQSSYGTAPSLATDNSTVAESSQGFGGDPRNNRSPSDSLGFSPDEFGDTSPDTPNDTHQNTQQSQQHQQNQQYQISPNEADGNNSSNGTGKYFCTVCQKRFTRPSALAVHSHMHTGAKPFACQICDRSFSVNSNLRRHMKTHSREEIVAADQ